MKYSPQPKNKTIPALKWGGLFLAVICLVLSRCVPAYPGVWEMAAVLFLTVFIYFLLRDQTRFTYECVRTSGKWEFLVWKTVGRKKPVVEARFWMEELQHCERCPESKSECRKRMKPMGQPSVYRYLVSLCPRDRTLLHFFHEGYGNIVLLLEDTFFLDSFGDFLRQKEAGETPDPNPMQE